MPPCKDYRFLVVARCDLSGWVEAKPLRTLSSRAVADFLWKDVICRHGCFGKLVIDGGSENKEAVAKLAQRYGVKRVVVLAYHPQANGMIERGHKPIVDRTVQDLRRGDRLKRFYPRQRLHLDHIPDLSFEELPNLDDFLLSDGDNDLSDVPDDLSDPEYG